MLHSEYTQVRFGKPSMCRHGLGTQDTERSSMSHMVDVINIGGMSTFETALPVVTIRGGVMDWDHVITKIVQGMTILVETNYKLISYYKLSLVVCLQIS